MFSLGSTAKGPLEETVHRPVTRRRGPQSSDVVLGDNDGLAIIPLAQIVNAY